MKQDILSRYEFHSHRRLAIDVSVGRIEELFENFDSGASYVKKDLDQDFVEYLIESVREIGGFDFVIRINLPLLVQEKHRKKVRKSIKSYFRYLELLERGRLRKLLWRSFLLFCLGLFLLIISLVLRENLGNLPGGLQELLLEGLTIAAWISLWTALGTLIFKLVSIVGNIGRFRRIAGCEVIFKSSHLAKSLHTDDIRGNRSVDSGNLRHSA